jgi:hypothetical protein
MLNVITHKQSGGSDQRNKEMEVGSISVNGGAS